MKKLKLNEPLKLSKKTIASLEENDMAKITGGRTIFSICTDCYSCNNPTNCKTTGVCTR